MVSWATVSVSKVKEGIVIPTESYFLRFLDGLTRSSGPFLNVPAQMLRLIYRLKVFSCSLQHHTLIGWFHGSISYCCIHQNGMMIRTCIIYCNICHKYVICASCIYNITIYIIIYNIYVHDIYICIYMHILDDIYICIYIYTHYDIYIRTLMYFLALSPPKSPIEDQLQDLHQSDQCQ